MAALGVHRDEEVTSASLALSVNAEPSFVRKLVSKLSKAGLVKTTRGKGGACVLARPPGEITLLDIYRASHVPPAFSIHRYAVAESCPTSCNIKGVMALVLGDAQAEFEKSLARRTLSDLVDGVVQA
jgi:Rrf2 family protein